MNILLCNVSLTEGSGIFQGGGEFSRGHRPLSRLCLGRFHTHMHTRMQTHIQRIHVHVRLLYIHMYEEM